ncbi:MAG: two-component sensor histidine kinase [Gammaproteobacteria bacterium RIFCSPHIGHO2_12_FULL_41_15]|nr:MAG: two-component sensor histidine kinase [Gammaproteobacteria bacterium RIFCSPHIGHO2_12_FULL_41_15]
MTPSIRAYLLINLLLSVTLITSIAIIGNLFLEHKDIQTQLDSQLLRSALQIQALFSDGMQNRNISLVQKNISDSMKPEVQLNKASQQLIKASKNYHDKMSFQLWDENGKLILHSKATPTVPLSDGKTGLSTRWINSESWRVMTTFNKQNQLTLMVAERSDFRQELENQLTQDSIFIMLLTYPFLGVMIWIIVGRGLAILRKVAEEVSHRKPNYLEPVNVEVVPTEIEPLVRELNHLFSRLKGAFEREKRFAADAAHELRTPLAAISSQVQVALHAESMSEIKNAMEKVLKGVDRSTHVVQQLLTMSRMVPDAGLEKPHPVNLQKQAAEIIMSLVPLAIEKNIEVGLETDESQPITILGNGTSIGILIRNLVDNAIRYTPEGGEVTVKIEYDKNQRKALLRVIDTGPGIPEELRERVFERFFRVVGTNTKGSGLGLSIAAQIVKLHKAKLELHTPESGSGLEVRVYFE